MYKKILVPMALDHGLSESTLAIAKALCSPGGSITALHIYETPSGSVSTFLDESVVREGFQTAKAMLEEKTAGVDGIKTEIVKGHTYRTIIDYAAEHRTECIVIGSHKPGLSDYLMGTTAARVVRHSACAVHVYRGS
ncbi:Universal stress protein G [Shimia sp. SK013]|uniref:universal stress protein n=1 Tax=Shimia sp. SK013 TaxID=1389006 RepID=UPI0006B5C56D|nr:universal stress protein [Shimia sp. SK013]KPA23354.1 Universal stress protein G [Shimia sp. SK013]